ncbi:hypothetical protein ACQ4P5_14245 [Ralstonia sp. L16]|uniref:hypothetical protein n=1 Tax=Ralstonia sp. L16 TaxID=3423950 RepID=UPI003F794A49
MVAKSVAVLGAILVCSGSAHAYPKYKNAFQMMSASLVSPESARVTIADAVAQCAPVSSNTSVVAKKSEQRWLQRHANYLHVAGAYRKIFKDTAASPQSDAETRKKIGKLLNVDVPEMLDANKRAQILPLKKSIADGSGAQSCADFFEMVDDGALDLEKTDAELAAFLKQGAPK